MTAEQARDKLKRGESIYAHFNGRYFEVRSRPDGIVASFAVAVVENGKTVRPFRYMPHDELMEWLDSIEIVL
jgi:hypothetical protein